jgi:DtxR family Mn-dependent transcriptional regulator
MVKRLDELGLAEHTPYHGVRLTAAGRRVALRTLRRHRLLELFLTETLDLPWDRVHQEAELLEHSLSDELEAAIAERLGNPTHDPHGDPIPSAELDFEEPDTVSLAELETGAEGRFVRVSDADPAVLRHLGERGVKPGQRLRLVEREPFGGSLVVRLGRRTESLGPEIARSMRVEPSA